MCIYIYSFFYFQRSVGNWCLDLSVWCLELSVVCLDSSSGCLDLSSGCLDLSDGFWELSFGCLELIFGCLDVSFGCLDVSFGCFELAFAFEAAFLDPGAKQGDPMPRVSGSIGVCCIVSAQHQLVRFPLQQSVAELYTRVVSSGSPHRVA